MVQPLQLSDLDTLLHKDDYFVEELASLLHMDPYRIRAAARRGALDAFIVDHHVVTISRDAAIRWLLDREASRV